MANDSAANTYEEVRKQRLLDNKKRFEDLGISKISKNLSDLTKSERKTQPRQIKPKLTSLSEMEPRRSSRARNPVPSYRDEVDIGLPSIRKRKLNSSWASYLARPLNEVKSASYEEKAHAMACAEKVRSNLQSENPSFIKSMVRSHVYSCFWLGLPHNFCQDHLPKSTENMVLENEDGTEYDAVYIGERSGLSGGWRAFALDHKLDDGDALVFELVEPTRFKVYIVRVSDCSTRKKDHDEPDRDNEDNTTKNTSTKATKLSDKSETRPKRSTKPKENFVETSKHDESDGDNEDNDTKRTSAKATKLSEKSETRPKRSTKPKENVVETSKRSSTRLRNRK
ncbi:hypothetical protein LguiA_011867 [Lonicera macranthoides]